MTKEYREYAKSRIEYLLKICRFDERDKEALEAAIQALSQEPTDTWSIKDVADTFTKHGLIREQEPCDDAISRKVTLDAIRRISLGQTDAVKVSMMLEKYVKKLPSVTQKPKTGHWIYDEIIENWRCSKCDETPKTMGYVGTADFMAEHFKFCNHCGAKMESEEKE